jgi:two-component system, cell cycle response regulator DivK
VLLFALARPDPAPKPPVVLIVEDHADTRQMYVEFLKHSFEILEAGTGQQALDMARARPPALVVTDLSLPGMDGFELIARIRREPATRTVPVVCISGYSGHSHEERARAAGCDRVIQKPCLPDTLADAIGEVLSETAKRGEP